MNFLAEVLTTAGEVEMINVKEKVPQLVSQINKLKCEVKNYMTNSHIDLKLMKKKSNNLLLDANKLNEEMKELNCQIENLIKYEISNTTDELQDLAENLQETSFALNLVNQLVKIDEHLKSAKECASKKKYLEAITNVNIVNKILNDIPTDECLDIIQAIKVSATIEHELIINETSKIWNESVVTDKKVSEEEITLSIVVNYRNSDELCYSIKALCLENPFIFELQCLSNFLMNEIFTSIINKHCVVDIVNDSLRSSLNITVKSNSQKMPYNKVFNNIQSVIEFLIGTINFEIKKDLLLLGFVGKKISEQFCELLIKNCLADTIPSTSKDLEKYDAVVDEIKALQKILTECQFLKENDESILEYAKNIDVLFANKTCQLYLDKARNILKKDLHDMIEVGTDQNTTDNSVTSANIFSKCFVSRNVNEYLNLVREILDQAYSSSDMCAGRLVYTAEQIIGLYYKLVPEYHKKLLTSIPQQVALFYNNCNFIAHELLNLNKYQHDKKASVVLKNQLFISHVQLLRTSGSELFLTYMRSQILQIEEILKDSEFAKLSQTDKIDSDCEKPIRQCLRQLELLKTVWQKVLTHEIYNKTIGELLNAFVKFLIKFIVGVEDISSENCTLLVEVYGIVKGRAPKLFTEPREINLYVKHWYKFNELIILLNSNLADITDRWADGKGPLAVEFTPEEVKGMIRALFQNTDKRSAVLARIN